MKKFESDPRQNRSLELASTLKMVESHNSANPANSATLGLRKTTVSQLRAIFSNCCQSREGARKFLRSHPLIAVNQAMKREAFVLDN